MVYKSGPSTDPCGTPNCRGTAVEYLPSIQTACVRPVRYEQNHSSAVPEIPILCQNWWRSVLWLMVSKAALRSNRTRMTPCLLSMCVRMSFCTLTKAVSVEWYFLYADCITSWSKAQTDIIYIYEFGGSFNVPWADLQRPQAVKAKVREIKRLGVNKANYLSIWMQFWHSPWAHLITF